LETAKMDSAHEVKIGTIFANQDETSLMSAICCESAEQYSLEATSYFFGPQQ